MNEHRVRKRILHGLEVFAHKILIHISLKEPYGEKTWQTLCKANDKCEHHHQWKKLNVMYHPVGYNRNSIASIIVLAKDLLPGSTHKETLDNPKSRGSL